MVKIKINGERHHATVFAAPLIPLVNPFEEASITMMLLFLLPLSLLAKVGTVDVLGTVADPAGAVVSIQV